MRPVDRHPFRPWRRLLVVAALAVALVHDARGQAHETRFGDYVLRGSVVRSDMLPEPAARAHGVDREEDRAVLNVTVLHGTKTLPAEVQASAFDLNGRRRTIEMRPVTGNDRVSYLGEFDFLPREVLDFRIEAVPLDGGPRLELAFRDRMWFY